MTEGGLYEIWKLERRAWLEGPPGSRDFTRPDALIVSPYPMPVQSFEKMASDTQSAAPFTELDMTDRRFVEAGQTVIISYTASARHQRFRRRYVARCMTVYTRTSEGWSVLAHQQAIHK